MTTLIIEDTVGKTNLLMARRRVGLSNDVASGQGQPPALVFEFLPESAYCAQRLPLLGEVAVALAAQTQDLVLRTTETSATLALPFVFNETASSNDISSGVDATWAYGVSAARVFANILGSDRPSSCTILAGLRPSGEPSSLELSTLMQNDRFGFSQNFPAYGDPEARKAPHGVKMAYLAAKL